LLIKDKYFKTTIINSETAGLILQRRQIVLLCGRDCGGVGGYYCSADTAGEEELL